MAVIAMPPSKRRPATPQKTSTPDTSGWLDRVEIQDKLNISVHTIMRWERRGLLHPVKALRRDTAGAERVTYVYDPDEIAKLPNRDHYGLASSAGEVAARVFEMFYDGKTIGEIVVKLRETPEKIEALHEKWLNGGGADLVVTPEMKTELEKLVGPFGNVGELVAQIAKKITERPT